MTEPDPVSTPDGPQLLWQRIVVLLLVAVALPSAMVMLVLWKSPEFSVFDEPAHSDYLRRIEQGEVPRIGDKMLEESVRDVQCRTVQGRTNAPCGLDSYEPEILGANGFQYEAQQPPLYYMITAGLRQVARIGPADNFVTTARLTGVAWLSAGLLVFVAACRRLGCRWWPTMVITGLLAVSPGVLYQTATITNDAAAILTGASALLMFAAFRGSFDRKAVAIWSFIAVLLVLIKPIGVLAVGAASVALFADALIDRRLSRRRALAFAAPVVAGAVTYLAWSVVRDARAVEDYQVVLDALLAFKQVDNFPLDDVFARITRLLGAYSSGAPISPDFVANPSVIVMYALAATGFICLWAERGGTVAQRIGGVALLTMLAAGPAFTVLFYLDYSVRGGPPPRYGLSLLPLLAVAAASTYRTRRAMVALTIAGLVVFGALMVALFFPETRLA